MISKIHNIRGVGRFKDFGCRQGIDFAELTLIYSENGQGKSTFADILRSLSEGDEKRLLGRKTVGATDQFIKFETEEGVRCLHNGSWNQSFGDTLVFDEIFINDNVYEGLKVSAAHREKLHPIIVGEGQKLGVQKEEELVAERDETTSLRTEVRRRIESALGAIPMQSEYKLSFEQFINLAWLDDIDKLIESQKKVVNQHRDADQIHGQSKLKLIEEFVPPIAELRQLLEKQLSCIADDAKEILQAHVDRFAGDEMKSWLRHGSQYIDERESETDDICPYCGQSLSGSSLIEHYQAIFEDTYEAFETEVSSFSSRHLDFTRWITDAKSACESNPAKGAFWASHLPEMELPNLDMENVEDTLSNLVAEMSKLLEEKQTALFKEVETGLDLNDALTLWNGAWKRVERYNSAINSLNRSVDFLRSNTTTADLVESERELARLEYTQLRQTNEVASDCESFAELDRQWNALNGKINEQRKANTKAIRDTFKKYGKCLEKHLSEFGASFRIKDLTQSRTGGKLRAEYKLGLADKNIELGKPETDVAERSFRNVLSEGDKRTLALAFFLSTIDGMSETKKAIVVFDDPVTSLDENRRMYTSEAIVKVCKWANQVIVLSHRPDFLHSVWSDYMRIGDQKKSSSLLEIQCNPDSPDASIIGKDWDINKAVKNYHAKNIDNVVKFIHGPVEHAPDYIWKLLRPILETHFQSCYPDIYCGEVTSLGKFLQCIVTCEENSPLSALKGHVADELNVLNIKLTPSQHGGDPAPITNRDQLLPYCRRVLALVGRPQVA